VLRIRIWDPGSGIWCLFDPWIRDPGWAKSQDPDQGSGMNNPDHISQSSETIFWVKIRKFYDADPGSRSMMDKIGSGIQDGKKSDPESRKNIPDPQHWLTPCTSVYM
jgi:hypothetical protein